MMAYNHVQDLYRMRKGIPPDQNIIHQRNYQGYAGHQYIPRIITNPPPSYPSPTPAPHFRASGWETDYRGVHNVPEYGRGDQIPIFRPDIPPPPRGQYLHTGSPHLDKFSHQHVDFGGATSDTNYLQSQFGDNLNDFISAPPPLNPQFQLRVPTSGVSGVPCRDYSRPGPSHGPDGSTLGHVPRIPYADLMKNFNLLKSNHSKIVAELSKLKSSNRGGQLESGGEPLHQTDSDDPPEEDVDDVDYDTGNGQAK